MGCICDCLSCDLLSEGSDYHLITAARSNNLQCVKSLLMEGSDVNARDHNGYTALICAAGNGNDTCIDLLLQTGADVNLRSNDGFTALIKAAENGHDKCVKALLRAGAKSTKYALIAATLKGCEKCVHMLLKEGADVNGRTDGTPVLICAAEDGHDKCVDLLIRAGADVNATGSVGDTSLMKASRNGHSRCVELLIKGGAHVNEANNKSSTSLMKAAGNGRDKFQTALLESGLRRYNSLALYQRFIEAAVHSSIWCVQLLLQAEADVNRTNDAGLTALTSSIVQHEGDITNLSMLLLAAGDTIDGNTHHRTTTVASVVNGEVKIPDYLLVMIKPETICLMSLCRDVIRKHLISLNCNTNLFIRIPQLGLPSLLTQYLLYNMSLTESYDTCL